MASEMETERGGRVASPGPERPTERSSAHRPGGRAARTGRRSGGFGQDGVDALRIEEVDLEGRGSRGLASCPPRRRCGSFVGGRPAEERLGGRSAQERAVRPEEAVVQDGVAEALLEGALGERSEDRKPESPLERPPEALDDRDGTAVADGAEAMRDGTEAPGEDSRRELASLVRDEERGRP